MAEKFPSKRRTFLDFLSIFLKFTDIFQDSFSMEGGAHTPHKFRP